MNKLQRWMVRRSKSLSLKSRLFLLLAVISIVPSLVVYYSSQHYMIRSNTQYSVSISNQYLQTVSQDIQTYLQNLIHSFDPLIVDYDFQQYLHVAKDDYITQAQLSSRFRTQIDNVLKTKNNQLTGVLYLDQSDKFFYESYEHSLNFRYSFERNPYYEAVRGIKSVKLSAPHSASYVLGPSIEVISLVLPVTDLQSGTYTAWLILEIKSDAIRHKLTEDLSESGSHLLLYNRSSQAFITNHELGSLLPKQLQASLQDRPPEGSAILFEAEKVQYEASYLSLPYGDWSLVWFASLSELTSGVKHSLGIMIAVAILSLAAALFIAFPVMRLVFFPLTHLKKGMRNLSMGIYLPVTTRLQNDEIGFLVQTFNKMLVDLKHLEKEVYGSRLKEKERELLQLQAQINPHFLFNTLETIESYAYKNNPEAVGTMVQSVSRIMRYNVRDDGGWALLEEELDYIRHYLRIHTYRSGTEVAVDWDIDASCLRQPVMKLSIQPFVENALKYAWSPNLDADHFQIAIRVRSTSVGLMFSVSDTGEGTSSAIMDKIEHMEEANGVTNDPYFKVHTGIYNIYRRFFLAYGDHVRFEMKPNTPHGTVVQWTIHKKEV
jgi:two-component system sensor histidine kinase YesM